MVKFISLLGLSIFFVASLVYSPHVNGANSVYISELNYNGSSVSGGDKWVELQNPTNSAVNLSGWKLIMPNSSKTGTVSLSNTIPANSAFVIGVKNAKFTNLYSSSDILNYNITNISNTQASESNYINVQLSNDSGTLVSQVQKDDNYVKSLGVSSKGSVKRSLECDSQGICNLSNELYGGTGLDYGSPGISILPLNLKEIIPTIVSQPELKPEPAQVQIQDTPATVTAIIAPALQPEIKTNVVSITTPESVTATSPVGVPTLSPTQVLKSETINTVEQIPFSMPVLSFKPIEQTVVKSIEIPEIQLQSFSSKAQPMSNKANTNPEIHLLSLVILSSYRAVSKTRFILSRFSKA
jgi:Lamin Tail Domain